MPHGKLHELDGIADLELLHDSRAVRFHGLGRKRQGLRDRGVGAPFDDQLQHVPLTQGEAVERADVRAFAEIVVDHRLGDPVAQVSFPGAQRSPRLPPSLARGFLEDVALRARLQGAVDVLRAQIHGEDQHARLRAFLDDAPRRLDAVELRHGDVNDADVRFQAQRLGDRLAAVARRRDHLQVARFEQGPKTVPDDRVIVGKQHRYRHVAPPLWTWYSTSTCTPARGPAFSENWAPTASARSRMINSPQPDSRLDLSTRFGSKPTPSSRTDRVARPLARRIAISTRCAFECLATLLSASWAIRNMARSTGLGRSAAGASPSKATRIPVLREKPVASERRAAGSP